MTGLTPEEQASYAETVAAAQAGRTVPLSMTAPRRGKPPVHWADLDAGQRAEAIAELGLPKFRAGQLTKHLFDRLSDDPEAWTDIPRDERVLLAERFAPPLLHRVRDQQADAGTTVKTLWRMAPKELRGAACQEVVWEGLDVDLARLPIITFPKNAPPYRQIAPYFQDEKVLASSLTSSNSLFAIINLIIDGFGVAAIPAVIIRRELQSGLLHPIQVSKRFPPLPIIATYQSTTHQDIVLRVVEQAQRSAASFCAGVDPATAWLV